eukprot:10814-Heterococcus_DN1.PRE.1
MLGLRIAAVALALLSMNVRSAQSAEQHHPECAKEYEACDKGTTDDCGNAYIFYEPEAEAKFDITDGCNASPIREYLGKQFDSADARAEAAKQGGPLDKLIDCYATVLHTECRLAYAKNKCKTEIAACAAAEDCTTACSQQENIDASELGCDGAANDASIRTLYTSADCNPATVTTLDAEIKCIAASYAADCKTWSAKLDSSGSARLQLGVASLAAMLPLAAALLL